MSIRAECNRCLEEYRVKDEFAGEVIHCKACGASFRVPHEDGFDEVVGRRPRRSRQSGRHGRRRGKTRGNVISEAPWVVGVAVFVAACAVGGGVLVAVNQMRGAPDVPGVAETEPATNDVVPAGLSSPENPATLPGTPQVAPTGRDDLFDIASVPVPRFPELRAPYSRFPDGSVVH